MARAPAWPEPGEPRVGSARNARQRGWAGARASRPGAGDRALGPDRGGGQRRGRQRDFRHAGDARRPHRRLEPGRRARRRGRYPHRPALLRRGRQPLHRGGRTLSLRARGVRSLGRLRDRLADLLDASPLGRRQPQRLRALPRRAPARCARRRRPAGRHGGAVGAGDRDQPRRRPPGDLDDRRRHRREAAAARPDRRARSRPDLGGDTRHAGRRAPRLDAGDPAAGLRLRRLRGRAGAGGRGARSPARHRLRPARGARPGRGALLPDPARGGGRGAERGGRARADRRGAGRAGRPGGRRAGEPRGGRLDLRLGHRDAAAVAARALRDGRTGRSAGFARPRRTPASARRTSRSSSSRSRPSASRRSAASPRTPPSRRSSASSTTPSRRWRWSSCAGARAHRPASGCRPPGSSSRSPSCSASGCSRPAPSNRPGFSLRSSPAARCCARRPRRAGDRSDPLTPPSSRAAPGRG